MLKKKKNVGKHQLLESDNLTSVEYTFSSNVNHEKRSRKEISKFVGLS